MAVKRNRRHLVISDVRTSDGRYETPLDMTLWLIQASEESIVDLAQAGWRDGRLLDHFEETNIMIALMLAHVRRTSRKGIEVRAECSVPGKTALAWLKINRPEIHARIA